jgi:ribosomal protein S18 acetylase RimI-like enzyme
VTAILAAKAHIPQTIRPLNIWRDLTAVADLVELCFGNTLDPEGRSSVDSMRRRAHDSAFLSKVSKAIDSTSLPLSGYVWEEENKIIGNVSLIPFHFRGKKIQLIANVATHPDQRRRGIARALTERAIDHARARGVDSIWLHVREDNPGAIYLYETLGFSEIMRRSTWTVKSGLIPDDLNADISINPATRSIWSSQSAWLARAYPEAMQWYAARHWDIFRPGLIISLYRLMQDVYIDQIMAHKGDQLLGALSRYETYNADHLWAALPPDADGRALHSLLLRARRSASRAHQLVFDYPAHLHEAAIVSAGFKLHRTLIWMRAPGATSNSGRSY